MTELFKIVFEKLPLPLLITIAAVYALAWLFKEFGKHKAYAAVLRNKYFLIATLVVFLAGITWYNNDMLFKDSKPLVRGISRAPNADSSSYAQSYNFAVKIANLLLEDEAIVEVVNRGDFYYLVFVSRGSVTQRRIDISKIEFEKHINLHFEYIWTSNSSLSISGNYLANLLFMKDIRDILCDSSKIQNLGFVLTNPVKSLPFETLPFKDGFLIDYFNVFYAESMEAIYNRLTNPRVEKIGEISFLGIGAYRTDPLSTQREIEAVYKSLSNSIHKDILIDKRINKKGLLEKLTKADIAHFAIESVATDRQSLNSGIVLSQKLPGEGSSDDGLLMGYEIAETKLKSELVTLSACQTGVGELVLRHEELLNCAVDFLYSGVATCAATRWKVSNDGVAIAIWSEFNQNRNTMGDAEALSSAIRTIRDRKIATKLYEWGAFYMLGHWRKPVKILDPGN